MAVISNLEQKAEAAWVIALKANTDLSPAASIVAFHDSTVSPPVYPVIVVQALEEQHDFAKNAGFGLMLITVTAYTQRKGDTNKQTLLGLVGGIRDTFQSINLEKHLNEPTAFTIVKNSVRRDGASFDADETRLLGMGMSFTMSAVATDTEDPSSSSSSSSSHSITSSSSSSSSSVATRSSSSSSSSSQSSSSQSTSSTSESSANTSSSTSVSSLSSTSESSG